MQRFLELGEDMPLSAYCRLLLSAAYSPFVRQAISEAIESERAMSHLRLVCGSAAVADIYADCAREQHAAEVAEAIRQPWAPRSFVEILREKKDEAAAGCCRWPGRLTPNREAILAARYLVTIAQERSRPMKITVNGKEVEASSPLSYTAAVSQGLWREGDSVTYQGPRVSDSRRSGILAASDSVELEEGMRFSSSFTGNA